MPYRRRSATTPGGFEQILFSGGPASPRAPPPHAHVGASSPSTTHTLSHPSPSTTTHSRNMSTDVVKGGKRLSLHFPIQPATANTTPGISPRSRPQSLIATPIMSPEMITSPTETNFLTVLAAQERRVLELKDELGKAELELVDLKKQYWKHEGNKKRNDLRHVTQLQPLNTGPANITADDDDEDGSSMWMQKEMERRKALLSNTKTSQRKVFSGSRHTRQLSLLSPDKITYSPSFPQPPDIRQSLDETKRQPLSRNSTAPDIATQIANSMKDDRYDLSNLQRDILLQTGKRVATDLKDGLMTFLEDLRQATVGDEATTHPDEIEGRPNAKRQSSKASLKGARPPLNRNAASVSKKHSGSNADLIDISESFWKENGLDEPKEVASSKVTNGAKKTSQPTPRKTPQKTPQKNGDGFEDSWDTWDTPTDSHTTESSNESDSEGSDRSSPRTSTSSAGLGAATPDAVNGRNSIPWPDLVKLSPNNLKRTASHLMKEWEKNLTPPAEAREGSHVSGDYVGRSASPIQTAKNP